MVAALLALLVLCAAAVPALAAGKRVALVIGNARYQNAQQLENSGNDAKLIARTLALKQLGFTLIGGGPRLDLDKAGFDRAVREFGQAMQGADIALFYYAGHGLQVAGTNWLVPVDAKLSRPQDLEFVMVDAGEVLRQMQGAGTRLNVVILDACRDNPFLQGSGRGVSRGLAQMQAPEGTLISYATQPGAEAEDGATGDSPYTTALAQAMREPGLDLFQMFNHVGLAVKKVTDGRQLPWVSNSPIDGQFYFAGQGSAPAPEPAPAPAQQQVASLPAPTAPAQQRVVVQQQQPPRPEQLAEATMTKAATCSVDGFTVGKRFGYELLPVGMATSGDGWCWSEPRGRDGGGLEARVKTPPTHGEAAIVPASDGRNLFAYRATPGFAGADHFQVLLPRTGSVVDISVDVRAGK